VYLEEEKLMYLECKDDIQIWDYVSKIQGYHEIFSSGIKCCDNILEVEARTLVRKVHAAPTRMTY
jgi:hypothetical protein